MRLRNLFRLVLLYLIKAQKGVLALELPLERVEEDLLLPALRFTLVQ